MTELAVTVNAGGTRMPETVKIAMADWARSALTRKPVFVFVQEVPSDSWVAVWTEAGYTPFFGEDRGWTVRSALLVRGDVSAEPISCTPVALSTAGAFGTLHYHGSYVAVARWMSQRGPVLLASVHASPNEADLEGYGWTGGKVRARPGGGDPRYVGGRLWDSDMVLTTLTRMASVAPVLAAGDFNESRNFDLGEHGERLGTWGKEYFERVHGAHYRAWLTDRWQEERPTHNRLQLDHVLLSDSAAGLLAENPPPYLDTQWADASARNHLSDHIPVWFAVNETWIPPLDGHGS
ncbi:MAG TPA: endonuclease/exonuclease/phosphatase family protein [Jatrophihabitans sp.]|jgi:hypothetical protein